MRPGGPSACSVLLVGSSLEHEPLVADLREQGHLVSWVGSGAEAEIALGVAPYDVVLVDADGPSGGPPVRAVRAVAGGALLLALTGTDDSSAVVSVLDDGADDVVATPVDRPVLLARLRAHLRRVGTLARTEQGVIAVDDLTVDAGSRRCHIRAREVTLRAKEFDLLWLLVLHSGSVVTRLDLMSQVWDENWSGSTKTLDVTMAGLRRHLREVALAEGAALPAITTMRGHGYRLDPRVAEVEAG